MLYIIYVSNNIILYFVLLCSIIKLANMQHTTMDNIVDVAM